MYTEQELVRIAKRENNKKRTYLVINNLQGKHIPVSPNKAFQMFDCLSDQLKKAYGTETLLLVGFAETATAIGARLAIQLDSYYIQTTREPMQDVECLFFSESHSHATEQKLAKDDIESVISKVSRIVFVEDEITTGSTILNIIRILKEKYSDHLHFSAASLLNGMDLEAEAFYQANGIELFYLVKTNHQDYSQIAETCINDGRHIKPDGKAQAPITEYYIGHYRNPRRIVKGSAYAKACQILWLQIKEKNIEVENQNILVIGTEECMYPALFVGFCLEKRGCKVKCHATTRSPMEVSASAGYPLHARYELPSLYEEERRTFLYDIAKYDQAWIITDASAAQAKGRDSLIHALRSCSNEKIVLFWCNQ